MGISGTYGETGNGALLDTLDEYLTWPDSGKAYIDDTGARTIYLRAKMVSECTTIQAIFEAYYDADNIIFIEATGADDSLRGSFEGQGNAENAIGADTFNVVGTWVDIGYTWDTPAGEGTPTGDHATLNDGGTWDPDSNELGYVMADDVSEIQIGERRSQHGGCTEMIYLNQLVIMSGYQTALPTNW